MKQNILMLGIALVLLCNIKSIYAQTYYKTNTSNHILTETGYNDLKDDIKKQLEAQPGKVIIKEVLLDSIVSKDSIIKTMKLDIRVMRSNNGSRPEEKVNSYLNKKFPNTTFYDLNGNTTTLNDLKGKPIVINFWFTRCKPCIEEIPILNKLVKKYGDKVHFISITPDEKETISKFLKTHEFNYIHLVNARSFFNEIGSNSYPKNIFIDKKVL